MIQLAKSASFADMPHDDVLWRLSLACGESYLAWSLSRVMSRNLCSLVDVTLRCHGSRGRGVARDDVDAWYARSVVCCWVFMALDDCCYRQLCLILYHQLCHIQFGTESCSASKKYQTVGKTDSIIATE